MVKVVNCCLERLLEVIEIFIEDSLKNRIYQYFSINSIVNQQIFVSFLGVIVYAVLEAATILILARSFSPDLFGDWVLFYTGFFFFERIYQGFYGAALVRFLAGAESEQQEKEIVGSAWLIAILITSAFTVLIYIAFFFSHYMKLQRGFWLFFVWYPLISFIRIPLLNSLSILQAKGEFKNILYLRLFGMGLFVIIILINWILINNHLYHLGVSEITIVFLLTSICGSLYPIVKGWSGLKYIFCATWKTTRLLFNYGKYSMGTLFGSNLLRDADILLIGIFMKSSDVALYSIPLKLIDILNVPLAAMVAVVFPIMSKHSQQGDHKAVVDLFHKYTGMTTILFIPFLIILALLAEPLIALFGGTAYLQTKLPTRVFQIFLVYGLFLTTDRFLGVTLDSINKPNKNLLKVMIMALINIAGSLIAILVFKSLLCVALVTIINVLSGIWIGFFFLKRELKVEANKILSEGVKLIREFKDRLSI